MAKDYSALPLNELRRKDRQKDESWIKDFITKAPFGTLAMAFENQPFVNSNIFVYDEAKHVIYLHTANVGRTPAVLEQNPNVCFSVSEMGRLLPADIAMEFSVEYSGVTVFGEATIIKDEEEAKYAAQKLLDKYFPHLQPGEHYRATTNEELKRTSFYRIDIKQWSGKQKQAEEDFPGAFWYDEKCKRESS